MRRFGESESKYLKGSDLRMDNGAYTSPVVTIETITVEEIGDDKTQRYILYFLNKEKGLCLNVTNEQALMAIHGEPPDLSPAGVQHFYGGKQIQLYFDPSIMFGSKRVGGLRLRAAPAAPSQAPPTPPPPAEEPPPPSDGDVPF